MSNELVTVKTFRQGARWGYRVVNGVGATLVTRNGYAGETLAREAGLAAAAALAPLRRPMMIANSTTKHRNLRKGPALEAQQGRSFWSALIG